MSRRGIWLVAPYVAWMVLMAMLPGTAVCYAVRGAATAVLLIISLVRTGVLNEDRSVAGLAAALGAGLVAGLAVFAVWVAPEVLFGVGGTVETDASPYSPTVCGWPLTVAKLAASAFVIPAAEELFFRKWLVDFAGFWWMVALFAVEHGERWHVGAVAGIIYGVLAKRYGLKSAIIAHSVTNLVLGLYVVLFDRWMFW